MSSIPPGCRGPFAAANLRVFVFLTAVLCAGWLPLASRAVILFGPDQNPAGPNLPGAESLIARVGQIGTTNTPGFLGTPISERHFLTAAHIGFAPGDRFHYADREYVITARTNLPGSDFAIGEVDGAFPEHFELYERGDEARKTAIVLGKGRWKGDAVRFHGELRGWRYAESGPPGIRWGTNVLVTTVVVTNPGPGEVAGEFLVANFDADAGDAEVHLTTGDSGGPIFVSDCGTWKLAGVATAVDGHFTRFDDETPFLAALFDARGMNLVQGDNPPVRIGKGPEPIATSWYAARVWSRWADLRRLAGLPEKPGAVRLPHVFVRLGTHGSAVAELPDAPLPVVCVESSSAAGGTVAFDNGRATYQRGELQPWVDVFEYVGREGETTGWGAVYVLDAELKAERPRLLRAPDGSNVILWPAEDSPGGGTQPTFEVADAVTGPWKPLHPGGARLDDYWIAADAQASGAASRFYRLAWPSDRGTVETLARIRDFTREDIEALLAEYGVPGVAPAPVTAWKIVYRTVDARGAPTIASALLVAPTGPEFDRPLPLASYQHGTVTRREDVPSRLNTEGDIGLMLGASGYITILPDYIGLGDSPGFHPYHHAKSQATAVVDALRAARDALPSLESEWNGQLFLLGYSQGGHATLAAQRELETLHVDEFPLTASAPAAGAYDLSGVTATDLLSGREPPNPYQTAYLLRAYTELYNLAPSFADILREPYSTTLPPLFDGTHGSGEINAVLPARPVEILKPEVLQAFTEDPDHPLWAALRENDLHRGWVPETPTRFYHCKGDRDVIIANSEVAVAAFQAAGATNVELLDPFPLPILDHTTCAPFALLSAKDWFDSLVDLSNSSSALLRQSPPP
jgi:hypothetical protein